MWKEVDCRGLNCPQPVINTKKALESIPAGKVTTIVDNSVARNNVTLFAQNAGYRVEEKEEKGCFYLTITKDEAGGKQTVEKHHPRQREQQKAAGPVYLISSNCFGQGSPDLGAVLMKSLMLTLTESDPFPEALIFLNSGVYLVSQGSEVLPYIKSLAEKGTTVLACGTCLEYYRLKDKLAVGKISNMYEINNKLTGPGKVISIS